MKALKFVGSSLDDLRDFPAEARRQVGFELDAIQRGHEPSVGNLCKLLVQALERSEFMF